MDESWLIPYADILTLLLALFIVLFASSSVDAKKFDLMSRVFNDMFIGGTGSMEYQNPVVEDKISETEQKKDNGDLTKQPNNQAKELTEKQKLEAFKQQDKNDLKKIQAKIDQYILQNNLTGKYTTKLTDEGLLLTLRDSILFQSGQAEVNSSYTNSALELSKLLELDVPRNIVISGHTDNIPIHNAKFSSNWELSVMRAVNFMMLLIKNPDLDPRVFSAKGYGEFKPLTSNDTAAGRTKNRRVEVLILPRKFEEQ